MVKLERTKVMSAKKKRRNRLPPAIRAHVNALLDEALEETFRSQFNEEELVTLTLAIVAINGASRTNVAFRTVPGSYQPAVHHAAE